MKSKTKKILYIAVLGLGVSALKVDSAAFHFGKRNKKKRSSTTVVLKEESLVWEKKQSAIDLVPEEDLLAYIREEAESMPKYVTEIDLRLSFNTWKNKQAREYHILAELLGIRNAVESGYVYFKTGAHRMHDPSDRSPTYGYKIHLMPTNDRMLEFAYRFARLVKKDDILSSLIPDYKFYVDPLKVDDMPRVVIYLESKADAQAVLNRIYELFKQEPGSGMRPRFSAYVTDFIWVTQGNGDEKRQERYQSRFEQPHMIYYVRGYDSKTHEFYLKHPETGADLTDPHIQ